MFNELINWSQKNYSNLPWRVNRSLYNTLVSEIMLQQTTVGTVINHFDRFVQKYPNTKVLSKASEEQMQVDWKGLGYYRRARNLRNAAIEIENKFQGEIPLDHDKLVSIKGIGVYTANAIIGIGANEKALAVDANLERVLARIYGVEVEKGPKLQKEILSLFDRGVICSDIKKLGSRNLNEALMDLGRRVCQARKTACEICPMRKTCKALQSARVNSIPYVKVEKKREKYYELNLLRVVCIKNKQVLVFKKKQNEWLSGQFEIPTFTIFSEDKKLRQYPEYKGAKHIQFSPEVKTSITKYRISNKVILVSESELVDLKIKRQDYEWHPLGEDSNFSTASFKSFKLLGVSLTKKSN